MEKRKEDLLKNLDADIDNKCEELKRKNMECRIKRIFIALCICAVFLPVILVLNGFSVLAFMPFALFTAVGFLALTPILLSDKLGGVLGE